MASEKIRKILSDEGVKESKGELSHFARTILQDIHMTPALWEYRLQRYLEKHEGLVPKNAKDRSYARGNLNTQFTSDSMTWRTFMEFLRFLGMTKIKITFDFTWDGFRKSTHVMNIRTRQSPEDSLLAEPTIIGNRPSEEDDIPDVVPPPTPAPVLADVPTPAKVTD